MQKRDTMLIVDDMELNRTILCGLFQDEYHMLEAENGEQALLLLKQYHGSIAIMLLDVIMPVKDGYQVLEEIGGNGLLQEVPVVVITADNSPESELRAFDLGASDIIAKPFEPHVVKRRVHNIIELSLHRHNLEEMVEEQAAKLRESNELLVDSLSSVIEYRSLESGQHVRRIRMLTQILLEEVRQTCPEYNLDEKMIGVIASASAMHDIGKIAIPDSIPNKPGRLTPEEFEIMKTHTVKGCEILVGLNRMSDQDYLRFAYNICRYHHERWDGRGYPDGLCGDAIPICSQAVGIVDAYDALTSDRVYKKAISHEQASNMILNGECGSFSPKLLECFKTVQPRLAELILTHADGAQPAGIPPRQPAPVSPEESFSALQMEQMKYYALLRYENSSVVEIDLATGTYHMVYSPESSARAFYQGDRLEDAAAKYALEMVHPDDAQEVLRIWREGLPRFFEEGLFKRSWRHRLLDHASGNWRQHQLTILRTDTEHPRQRKALLLWTKCEDLPAAQHVEENAILHNLLGGIFQCRNDQWLTLLHAHNGFLGFTPEELERRHQNRFLGLVHPDDRERVRAQLRQQLNSGSSFELEFRVNAADGKIFWMLCKGLCITDDQGEEVLYSVLIDIEQPKQAQEALRLSLERYKIILDQTNDIIFEWDISKDHVIYSSNWKDKFGYEPIQESASQRIPTVSHLHPEDMSAFQRLIQEMRLGTRYRELDFRVSGKDRSYRWCRIRATAQFDSAGNPCRVVGTIVDINDEKITAQKLIAQAQRDNLTQLYNKASARQKIERFLQNREPGSCAALFILDLDNFKNINDQFGHLFGDAVLTRVAGMLSHLFRNEDVVSRIGGDEFLVLVQGDLDEERAASILSRITDRFAQGFDDLPAGCQVLCSIGASLCPRDGDDFQTLFQRADMALYQAKSMGKNRFHIYDPLGNLQFSNRLTVSTRIESDARPSGVLNEVIPQTFHILKQAEDTDQAIRDILALVGARFQVSRSYIFETMDDGAVCRNTFEWCNEGVDPQQEQLQCVVLAELSSSYAALFNEQGVFYCPDAANLPPDLYAILQPQGIQSMLQCAIRDRGVFRGFVGFDNCDSHFLWTQDQIDVLTFVADLLSLFLLRRRAQERSLSLAENLRIVLDHQNSWIYVINPDTYELLYINQKTHSLVPAAQLGATCHGAFFARDTPCRNCPAADIRRTVNRTLEVYNPVLHVWSAADASLIRWEGRDACLLSCHDITPYKQNAPVPPEEPE